MLRAVFGESHPAGERPEDAASRLRERESPHEPARENVAAAQHDPLEQAVRETAARVENEGGAGAGRPPFDAAPQQPTPTSVAAADTEAENGLKPV
jgi:hypothetical protein